MKNWKSILGVTLILTGCSASGGDMCGYHRFYDFNIEGEHVGVFEISDDGSVIVQNAVFEMQGELYKNPFRFRYVGDNVTAVKIGDREWVDFSDCAEDHYPGCAYPIYLPKVKDRYEIVMISEVDKSIDGKVLLTREGDTISESKNGKIGRWFKMKGGVPVEISWGGSALSRLKTSKAEALDGSPVTEEQAHLSFAQD